MTIIIYLQVMVGLFGRGVFAMIADVTLT